jgi:hypothetical protein
VGAGILEFFVPNALAADGELVEDSVPFIERTTTLVTIKQIARWRGCRKEGIKL